jgi:hypothetical protein
LLSASAQVSGKSGEVHPSYAPGLNVTPHVIRRIRAMHLLQAKVNLIFIRDLLGHADISTSEIYARADAETKRKAIESAYQSLTPEPPPRWTADRDLLDWLARSADNRPDHVAGTRPNEPASSGNTPAGHITQPST